MAKLPEHARVVIIGQGGIVGASVAHHLIEAGWDDIVGLEKSAIPTDIGSTSHASDFCYMTSHDKLNVFTSTYSREFYRARGNYIEIGGMEVARKGDDERMLELQRKVASGKAFGSNAYMISAEEAKEKFPLVEEDMIQGAMWDPDAGLVTPRSQKVAGDLVDEAVESGKLTTFAYTAASKIIVEDGRAVGVETEKGTIMADHVVLCAGIWGSLVSKTAGVKLPLMPLEHPLLFFGPWDWKPSSGKMILALTEKFLPMAPSGGISVGDARNIAAGILAAMQRGSSGQRYVLAGDNVSYLQLWRKIAGLVKRRGPITAMRTPMKKILSVGGDFYTRVTKSETEINSEALRLGACWNFYDSSKAVNELGYDPGNYETALRDSWNWLVENGYSLNKKKANA